MIEVFIVHDGEPLAHIEIERVDDYFELGSQHPPMADYRVRFGVDRGSAVGVSSRMVHAFPRRKFNVFGLVRLVLDTLNEKEFLLESDYDIDSSETSVPKGLARGLRGRVQEVQARFGRLHHH